MSTDGNFLEGIDEADITVYHRKDQEWVAYFQGNLDHPKGIAIEENSEGEPYLWLSPNTEYFSENLTETKLEFPGGEEDIIRAQFDRSEGNLVCTKVWYNDNLRWEANATGRAFEVLK